MAVNCRRFNCFFLLFSLCGVARGVGWWGGCCCKCNCNATATLQLTAAYLYMNASMYLCAACGMWSTFRKLNAFTFGARLYTLPPTTHHPQFISLLATFCGFDCNYLLHFVFICYTLGNCPHSGFVSGSLCSLWPLSVAMVHMCAQLLGAL